MERAFTNCEKLQSHMKFLLNKGGLYKVYNGNLLYHGCVPLNEDGSLKKVRLYEVSVVTFPAYEDTGVEARKAELNDIKRHKIEKWRADMNRKIKGGI